jgi:PKD repeat protein
MMKNAKRYNKKDILKDFTIFIIVIGVFVFLTPCIYAQNGLMINEIIGDNTVFTDEDGDASDWIEIYNAGDSQVDLTGYYLTDDSANLTKWQFPDVSIEAKGYLVVFASDKNRTDPSGQLHTSFRLSEDDDAVILSDSAGNILDSITIKRFPQDISYGKHSTGDLMYFQNPTPGQPNNMPFSPVPEFSMQGGFYDSSVSVTLSTGLISSQVYYRVYNTDDNILGRSNQWQSAASPVNITLNRTSIVSAYSSREDCIDSPPAGEAYIINFDNKGLPVLFLAADYEDIWDTYYGIFPGSGDTPDVPPSERREQKRPAHIDFFDENRTQCISQACYIQTIGASSRLEMPRPFKMSANEEIDPFNRHFEYPVLKKPIDRFRHIQVRNNNQDTVKMQPYNMFLKPTLGIRNPLMADLCRDQEYYEFRDDNGPVLLLVNGDNMGIVNIGENRDNSGVARENPGVDSEDIDMITIHAREFEEIYLNPENEHVYRDFFNMAIAEYEEISQSALQSGGTKGIDDFFSLISYINSNNMSDQNVYDYVKDRLHLNSYIDGMAAQIIASNIDFAINNTAFWRSAPVGEKPGPFHLYNYDFDANFGVTEYVFDFDMLDYIYRTDKTLSRLLHNTEFRNAFIRKFDLLLNTSFKPENTITIADEYASKIDPWAAYHLDLWGRGITSYNDWKSNVSNLKNFLQQMPSKARNEVVRLFNLPGSSNISFNVYPENKGSIYIDTGLYRSAVSGIGTYFNGIPVTIAAEAAAGSGYRFAKFMINSVYVQESTFTFIPGVVETVTAVFVEDVYAPAADIVINEVVHSGPHQIEDEDSETHDWIELYNTTSSSISLNGMYITDNEGNLTKWQFPDISIGAGEFLVIYASGKDRNDPLENLHTNFKISSSGEPILLVDTNGADIIDQLTLDEVASISRTHSGGRFPDGSIYFKTFPVSTPREANYDDGSMDDILLGEPEDYNSYKANEQDEDGTGFTEYERHIIDFNNADIFDSTINLQLSASEETGTAPFSVTFTATPIADVVKYEWDFDGSGVYDRWQYASKGNTAEYKYTAAGTYNVRARATNSLGQIDTATITIAVQEPALSPTANISGSLYAYPAINEFTMPQLQYLRGSGSAKGVRDIVRYEWDFTGDGQCDISSSISGNITTTLNETISRVFTGFFKVTDSSGISDIAYINVDADASNWNGSPYRLKIDFQNDYVYGAAGSSITLAASAQAEGGSTYGHIKKFEWDFTGNGVSDWSCDLNNSNWTGAADTTHTYGAPGVYNACLKVHSSAGVSSYKNMIIRISGGEPAVRADARVSYNGAPETSEIEEGTIPVKAVFDHSQSIGAVKYEWDFTGDKNIDYATIDINDKPIYYYTIPGYHIAMLQVTDSSGMIDVDYIPVFCVYPEEYSSRISFPQEGQSIAGNYVTLSADVFPDNQGVSSVMFQYSQDGNIWTDIGEGVFGISYTVAWDTTMVSNADYQLRVIVNNMDSQNFKSTVIKVDNAALLPDIYENNNGSHVKRQKINLSSSNFIILPDGTSMNIPYGALFDNGDLPDVTVQEVFVPGAINTVDITITGTSQFSKDIILSIPYPDDDNDGIVDGTSIDENTLVLKWYNETTSQWEPLYDSTIFVGENYVSALVNHLSRFGIFIGDTLSGISGSSSGGTIDSTTKPRGEYCFIATAAYGTPMADEVIILKHFRDQYLANSPLGRVMIDNYYKISPPIAYFIKDKPVLRRIARFIINPIVKLLKNITKEKG